MASYNIRGPDHSGGSRPFKKMGARLNNNILTLRNLAQSHFVCIFEEGVSIAIYCTISECINHAEVKGPL